METDTVKWEPQPGEFRLKYTLLYGNITDKDAFDLCFDV